MVMNLTNEQLNADFVTAYHVEDHETMARIGAEATRRATQAREDWEAQWNAEIDALVAEAQARRDDEIITVPLNRSQIENFEYCLPMGYFGLTVLETRVRGRRADLIDAIEMIDADTIVEMREQRRDNFNLSWLQEERLEKQIRRGVKNLIRKLQKAVK
jgi:hypothetical protein